MDDEIRAGVVLAHDGYIGAVSGLLNGRTIWIETAGAVRGMRVLAMADAEYLAQKITAIR